MRFAFVRGFCGIVTVFATAAATAQTLPGASGATAQAQDSGDRGAATVNEIGHLEFPNMPRIQHDGQRYYSAPLPRTTLTLGPFQSIQANVGAGQVNIINDAANEPSIAVNRTNPSQISIGWRQFGNIASDFREAGRGFSTNAGATWTAPGPLTPGLFRSDPVLFSATNGRLYYFSLQSNFNCDMFTSTNGGQTWSGPNPAFGGDKQWMTVDLNPGIRNGNVYVVWSPTANCCGPNIFSRSFDGGLTFRNPTPVSGSPQWGQITVGVDSSVYVAGRNGSDIRVARSTNAQNPSTNNPTFTFREVDLGGSLVFQSSLNPVGLAGQVSVKADRSTGPNRGNVYVAASVEPRDGSDPLDLMIARSTDNGSTWSPPIRINQFGGPTDGSSQWFGMIDAAPNGRIDAVWNDTRFDPVPIPTFSHLRYAASFDGGLTWRYDIAVSPEFNHTLGYPVQRKIGDYYDLQSDDAGVSIAYSATYNGEQDVYYLRVAILDCNSNGTLDVNEVDAGTALDCNGNDIIDSCELATGYTPDCNANNLPDSCEIAASTETDCNANGVLDACEITGGTQPDCDANGVLDVCELTNPELDCNENGLLDACEIAAGTAPDCNGNGRPDECDLSNFFSMSSPRFSPIGAGVPQSWTLVSPPGAIGTVTLLIRARGDFNVASESLAVSLNGQLLGSVLSSTTDCSDTPQSATLTLSAPAYNAAVSGGNAVFSFVASETVNPDLCTPASFVEAAVSYASDETASEDANGNGVPDECELLRGDLNCDGVVTVTDVGPFVLALTDPAAYAAQFPACDINRADVNNDAIITVGDIAPFVALLTGR